MNRVNGWGPKEEQMKGRTDVRGAEPALQQRCLGVRGRGTEREQSIPISGPLLSARYAGRG